MTSELSWLQAVLLAVVQGLTEFLPISSTGHLVLARRLMGWSDAGGLGFDIVLHAGSLAAILIYFRHTWRALLGACVRPTPDTVPERRLAGHLLIATAPVMVVGPWLKPYLEQGGLRDLRTVSLSMLATALLFWLSSRRNTPVARPFGAREAWRVGLMQVLALLPGASRAGWSTAGGILAGQPAAAAVRFAFLMAAPTLGGAALFHGVEILADRAPIGAFGPLAAGFAVSLAVSVFAIHACLAYFRRHTLRGFGLYLAFAGLLTLVLSV